MLGDFKKRRQNGFRQIGSSGIYASLELLGSTHGLKARPAGGTWRSTGR